MKIIRTLLIEPTGIVLLAIAFIIAFISMGLFTVGVRLPFAAIASGGLIGIIPATIIAWMAFVFGRRQGLPQWITGIALLSFVHYMLLANLFSVLYFGIH